MHLGRMTYWAALLTTLAFFGCTHTTREQIIEKGLEQASIFEEINEKDS